MKRCVTNTVKRLKKIQKAFKRFEKFRQAVKQSYREIFAAEVEALTAELANSPKKKGKKKVKDTSNKYSKI